MTASSCQDKINENGTCSQTLQCYEPMTCTNNSVCQCGLYEYHDLSSLTCLPQKTYTYPCSVDSNCRVDKYLECQNGACQCISLFPVWSVGFDICIVPRNYSQMCYDQTDCDSSKGLNCKNGDYGDCSCPTSLLNATCDCNRAYGNEYYWDGFTCTVAHDYNQSCSNSMTSYMCKTLTEGTQCLGPSPYKCKCASFQYYNFKTKKCESQLTNSATCPQADACRSDLGLSCPIGVCECDTKIQFWNGTRCVNYYTYNTETCSTDSECKGSLICVSGGTTCNCPSIVSNTKCDCPLRAVGSEFYWNGIICTVANSYEQSCSNSSTSYMCKTLTQGTQCLGPSPYTCICVSLKYYNFQTNKCENQLTNNLTCSQDNACRSDLGLSCTLGVNEIGVCECNATIQFWTGSICNDYYKYNEGSCANDDQCYGNLICKTSGSCNCPLNVLNGNCDCPNRVSGNEYYWNGTVCVLAALYGQSCHTGDYTCQYLTQGTHCVGQCKSCESGWYYEGGSCYKGFRASSCTSTSPASSLAILTSSDLYWLQLITNFPSSSDNSDMFLFGANCFCYNKDTKALDNHDCSHMSNPNHHGVICEYVLV